MLKAVDRPVTRPDPRVGEEGAIQHVRYYRHRRRSSPVTERLIDSLQSAGIPRLRLGRRRHHRSWRRRRGARERQAARPGSRAGSRTADRRPPASATPAGPPTARRTLRNAHPQTAGRVTLAHNGIIENFAELKAELIAEGREFESDTDTEVVAHLIDRDLASGLEPTRRLQADPRSPRPAPMRWPS